MSAKLPNGAHLYIPSAFAASKIVTAISNDGPAVATSAAHGLTDGQIVLVKSGWSKLNDVAARVAEVDAGTFELEGIDTSDEVEYLPGAGAGSVRPVASNAWVEIDQIEGVAWAGGEQGFAAYKWLDDGKARQLKTGRSVRTMTLTLSDDTARPWHAVLLGHDKTDTVVPLRLVLKGGEELIYAVKVSYDGVPSAVVDQVMQVTAVMSLENDPIRYPAPVV